MLSQIDASELEYFVLDEADKLFEMGFVEQLDQILAQIKVRGCACEFVFDSSEAGLLTELLVCIRRLVSHELFSAQRCPKEWKILLALCS